ncbi:hypothetical protein LCGC14_2484830 [marine sediment metagenome]|uniref:Uncharacterized protein n=1 Tax=marine sediment metagenome TaxID=412755 RepID=A0A0F9B784_9ZZZZ
MIDKHSETWREIAAWAEGELAKATERIETLGVKSDETENLRGQITTLRELLAMQDDPEQRVIETVQDYGFQDPDT